jgi:hypothetical protein
MGIMPLNTLGWSVARKPGTLVPKRPDALARRCSDPRAAVALPALRADRGDLKTPAFIRLHAKGRRPRLRGIEPRARYAQRHTQPADGNPDLLHHDERAPSSFWMLRSMGNARPLRRSHPRMPSKKCSSDAVEGRAPAFEAPSDIFRAHGFSAGDFGRVEPPSEFPSSSCSSVVSARGVPRAEVDVRVPHPAPQRRLGQIQLPRHRPYRLAALLTPLPPRLSGDQGCLRHRGACSPRLTLPSAALTAGPLWWGATCCDHADPETITSCVYAPVNGYGRTRWRLNTLASHVAVASLALPKGDQ